MPGQDEQYYKNCVEDDCREDDSPSVGGAAILEDAEAGIQAKLDKLESAIEARRTKYASDAEMIADVFTYHAPRVDQIPKYERLRGAARAFATVICATCPPCADRSAALRHLREAVYTANGSIALDGRV